MTGYLAMDQLGFTHPEYKVFVDESFELDFVVSSIVVGDGDLEEYDVSGYGWDDFLDLCGARAAIGDGDVHTGNFVHESDEVFPIDFGEVKLPRDAVADITDGLYTEWYEELMQSPELPDYGSRQDLAEDLVERTRRHAREIDTGSIETGLYTRGIISFPDLSFTDKKELESSDMRARGRLRMVERAQDLEPEDVDPWEILSGEAQEEWFNS